MAKNDFGTYNDQRVDIAGRRLGTTAGRADTNWNENSVTFQNNGSITNSADRAMANFQLDHGTDFSGGFDIHMHWWQPDAQAYVMTYEYRIQENGKEKATAWIQGTYTVGDGGEVFPYAGETALNQLSDIVEIDISGLKLSDTIQFRIARTYGLTGNIDAYFTDAHFRRAKLGSDNEYTDERP